MTPEQHTPQTAADPATPPADLAQIAAQRPDLRAAVASNPSAYPALLQWLAGLGDPEVDAALRARAGEGGAAATGTGAAPAPFGDQAPAAPYGAQAPAAPYGAQAPAAPYGAQPPASPYGAQAPGSPYGGAASSSPFQQPGTPGYAYNPTAPPPRSSRKVLWIVLGVVGLLVVLGIAAVALFFNAVRDGVEGVPGAPSDEARLEELYDLCAQGDGQACDDLYFESPSGSEYEEFGDTCGGRTDGGSYCADELGSDGEVGGDTYGSDADLDALWDACDGGDDTACEELFYESPFGSEYETFGSTCGGREPEGTCT